MSDLFEKGSGGEALPQEIYGELYQIRLVDKVKENTFPNRENPDGPPDVSVQFQFMIDDPQDPWHGREFRVFYPKKYTERNKTGKLFKAILGVDELPEEIKWGDLKGGLFRGVLIENDRGYPAIDGPIPAKRARQLSAV